MINKPFKNKADLQFAIMLAAEKATDDVKKTMAKHLAVADELWQLTDAAIKAGLSVCLPSMRWVHYPTIILTAETDEEEVRGHREIEDWAAATCGTIEASRIEAFSSAPKSAVFHVAFPSNSKIVVTLTREIWE